MFKVLRAVANNLNKSKYMKLRNRIKFKSQDDFAYLGEANDKLPEINYDKKIEEIDYLQTIVRGHNLRVFTSAIFKARTKQFVVYTIPAILVATTILTLRLPNKHVKTVTLDAYRTTEIVFNGEKCIEDYEDGNIYYESHLTTREFVKPTDLKLSTTGYEDIDSDILYFRIRDDLDGILSKFTISPQGQLELVATSSGKFIDLDEYDFSGAEPLDEEYAKLFDDVVEFIQEERNVSDRTKELLSTLSASDKKEILGRIISFEELGPMDVEVYASNVWKKILLVLGTGLYLGILWYISAQGDLGYRRLYSVKNGELHLSDEAQESVFLLIKKYKEAFLMAEADRIKRLHELYFEIVSQSSYSPDELLTSYEKKLIY